MSFYVGDPLNKEKIITYNQRNFTLPPGEDLNQVNLGFSPNFAIVSNYSPYWVFLPDGSAFVPPWTLNAVISLYHANAATLLWQGPFVEQNLQNTLNYRVFISFTDNPNLAITGGSPINSPYKYSFIGYVYDLLVGYAPDANQYYMSLGQDPFIYNLAIKRITLLQETVSSVEYEMPFSLHYLSDLGEGNVYNIQSLDPRNSVPNNLFIQRYPWTGPPVQKSTILQQNKFHVVSKGNFQPYVIEFPPYDLILSADSQTPGIGIYVEGTSFYPFDPARLRILVEFYLTE